MAPGRTWPTAAAIFVAFAALYSLTALGRIDSYDGEMMYRVTESLVERRSLVVKDEVFRLDKQYAVFGLGTSLAWLPGYVVARVLGVDGRWAASLFNPMVTAATAAVLYWLARRLGFGPRLGLALAAVYGLGTLAWPYSKTFFSEPLTGMLLLAAAALARAIRDGAGAPAFGLLGLVLGMAVLTREESALTLPLFLIYAFWPGGATGRWAPGRLAALLVPLVALVALALWYHFLRFEGLVGGYEEQTGNQFDWSPGTLFTGLFGQLLSPGKGILFYSPIVALAPFAWRAFWRAAPLECVLFSVLIVERVLLYSGFSRWWAGVCWGPRYMVPILPLLVLAIGYLSLQPSWRGTGARLFLAGLAAASIVAQLPGVAIFYTDYLHAVDEFKVSWDDVFFVPRWSPLFGQLKWLAAGRNLAPFLPIPRPELVVPIYSALVIVAVGGALAALRLTGSRWRATGHAGSGPA